MADHQVEVLLVEDDPGDADLTRVFLRHAKVNINLNVVNDGVKAIAYLRQEGQYADAVRPDLILLDLNLPKKDGREVLRDIKSDETLKSIPVVVLTTSDFDGDVLKSYNLGANCYVTKPAGLEQFASTMRAIEDFWFSIVKLPPRETK